MADTSDLEMENHPASLGRKLAIVAGGLLFLLVLLYFVIGSSAFFKGVILPHVAKTLNATIEVDEASISPFSQVALRRLKVQTTGPEPLLAVEELRVRYRLLDLIRGRIGIEELTVVSAVAQVVLETNGTSNLDPLFAGKTGRPVKPSGPVEPRQLALKNIALKNATVRVLQKTSQGHNAAELADLNLTVDRVQNGQAGKVSVGGNVRLETHASISEAPTNGLVQAKVGGSFEFALDSALRPKSVQGATRFDLSRAEGALSDFAALGGVLECDLTPTEMRQLALRFERAGKTLGQVRVSGPLDLAKSEGTLKLEILSIDRQVLNLYGATRGWDFGASTLNSTNLVDISQKGTSFRASGKIFGRQLSLEQNQRATPPLDLEAEYQFTLSLEEKNAVLRKLSVVVQQENQELLQTSLDRPMNLTWGSTIPGFAESSFQLVLTNLNLGDWASVLGTNALAGKVRLKLNLLAQRDGRLLKTDLAAQVDDLAAQVGTNQIDQAQLLFRLSGDLEEFKFVNLNEFNVNLNQSGQSLAQGNGSLRFDLLRRELTGQSTVEASLPLLLQQVPLPRIRSKGGRLKCTSLFSYTGDKQKVSGNLLLDGFAGQYADYDFTNYQASFDYNLELKENVLQIYRAGATFRESFESGGGFEVAGEFNLKKKSGRFEFKVVDLNQHTLYPILDPLLAPRKLLSASISGKGSADYDPKGDTILKSELNISQLAIGEAAKKSPRAPLSADVKIDATVRQPALSLKTILVTLTDGKDPAGRLELNGQVNLTQKSGQVAFKAVDLNQRAFRPLLESKLAPNKLASVSLHGSGSAQFDPQGDSSLKAELTLTNLVVENPANTLPKEPLRAQVQLDGAIRKQILELRQVLLGLTPTPRAQNELQLLGRLDLTKTNAASGHLTLRAGSLDVTPYFDLFSSKSDTNAAVRAAAPPSVSGQAEPAAVRMPVDQLTLDLKINRLYLRDVAVSNLSALAVIRSNEMNLKPLALALNGAPVTGEAVLNLGVPGYAYDLSFQASKVPMEPLANSFSTNSRGQFQGELTAQARVKGAGVTGASLRKNLNGQAGLSLTNLNLQVLGPKTRLLLEPIALLLHVPELAQSPLNWVNATAQMGGGRINVTQFAVRGEAFHADVQGAIPMAEVLTNSPLDLPVNFSLRRSLAEKSNLLPPGAPPEATYVKLPDFVKLTGTLGSPKTETDKLVISGLLLRSSSALPGMGGKAGNILQGLGGVLTGQGLAGAITNLNPTVKTNSNIAPSTNKPAKINPLDLLRLIPRK
ncbi:MAG: AsmA family protein [Chloroflexi bacterium]|nr:AsmA family protein [Chloroflexota bacterium]